MFIFDFLSTSQEMLAGKRVSSDMTYLVSSGTLNLNSVDQSTITRSKLLLQNTDKKSPPAIMAKLLLGVGKMISRLKNCSLTYHKEVAVVMVAKTRTADHLVRICHLNNFIHLDGSKQK